MTFSTNLELTRIFCSIRLFLEEKADQEIPESSRLEFLEKSSENNFPLSHAEGNNLEQLNRGGTADLSLFRSLLAILEKLHEPCFWKVKGSFVLLA